MRMHSWMRPAALAAATWLAVWGCGDKKEPEGGQVASVDTLTFEKQLEQNINRAMDRLKYDDRSGLWENEFEYLHEEKTFDDYLKQPSVSRAKADTLEWVEVRTATRYGDSAVAQVIVHFKGLSGTESTLAQDLVLYKRGDKWIKPTMSTYAGQLAFDSLRQAAIDAAEREAGR